MRLETGHWSAIVITDLEQSERPRQLFGEFWKVLRLFLKHEAAEQSAALFWSEVVEDAVEQQLCHH